MDPRGAYLPLRAKKMDLGALIIPKPCLSDHTKWSLSLVRNSVPPHDIGRDGTTLSFPNLLSFICLIMTFSVISVSPIYARYDNDLDASMFTVWHTPMNIAGRQGWVNFPPLWDDVLCRSIRAECVVLSVFQSILDVHSASGLVAP